MTRQSPTPPTTGGTFRAVLRGTLVPAVGLGAATAVLGFALTGARGGLSATLGAAVVIAFFASGLGLMARLATANPLTVMAAAMAVYLGQVLVLGLVGWWLLQADWLEPRTFGFAAIAMVLAWQALQVRAFIRARKPVYDGSPADSPSGPRPVDRGR